MFLLNNDDQFLIGNGDKHKIVLLFHHGAKAKVKGSGGNALCHGDRHFMEHIKGSAGIPFPVQIQGVGKKIAQKSGNTADINGAVYRAGPVLDNCNAVLQDSQGLAYILIKFLPAFGQLDVAAFLYERGLQKVPFPETRWSRLSWAV